MSVPVRVEMSIEHEVDSETGAGKHVPSLNLQSSMKIEPELMNNFSVLNN